MAKSISHDRDGKKISTGRGSTESQDSFKENQVARAGKAVAKGIGKGIVRAVAGPKRK